MRPLALALWLATLSAPALASPAGSFADGGNTQVSAMMMFLGNEEKVYILDKSEGNAAQINGHSAMGAVWDASSRQASVMDIRTNAFCSSGMHLPNGSFATFGGNGAVGPGGDLGSVPYPGNYSAAYDATYQDYDGTKGIRILNPCRSSDNFASSACQWYDDPTTHSLQVQRWYSAAEPLANGTIVVIGGFTNGGYVNRNVPNIDPATSGGAAVPTYEFFPGNGQPAQTMQFMIKTSGLNAYAHTFLMASGQMFVQANTSTMLWDYENNIETPLPDMPNGVVRVYPASGATAMLPLTPADNYTQTILFCGGTDMPADAYGDYSYPYIDTWDYPASADCQRITPEPASGAPAAYEQDDDMPAGRTMGQFVLLPDGTMLVVNGAANGTAGYGKRTLLRASLGEMPWGESLAAGPVGTPAIYDPRAPKGKRWSSAGLATSGIARMYHSSAILLADGSVLIAGSNPNLDVNTSTIFPTTYQAEIFYPPYFSASARPAPTGIPTTLSYGGAPFDITIPPSSYSGSSNDAAASASVALLRPGFTTHGMNMGQRYLQLNSTYTVGSDGSITLHVAQAPPNPNLFQPGPAILFVVVHGVPSNGTMVIVGSGAIEAQAVAPAGALPPSVRVEGAAGSAPNATASGTTTGAPGTGAGIASSTLVALVVGTVVALAIVAAVAGMCVMRRRRAARAAAGYGDPGAVSGWAPDAPASAALGVHARGSDAGSMAPLKWNASTASVGER